MFHVEHMRRTLPQPMFHVEQKGKKDCVIRCSDQRLRVAV